MEWPEIAGAYAGFCRAGDEFIRGGEPGLYERGQRGQRRLSAELAAYNAGQQRMTTPGTTINSQPQGPSASMTAPQYFSWMQSPEGSAWAQRQQNSGNASLASQAAATQLSSGGFGAGNGNPEMYRAMLNQASGYLNAGLRPTAAPAAAASPAAPTPPDMRQIYLNSLANPDPVPMPGAHMTGAPTAPAGGNNVMTSWLANFRPTGGGGTNQSFIDIMRNLNYGADNPATGTSGYGQGAAASGGDAGGTI